MSVKPYTFTVLDLRNHGYINLKVFKVSTWNNALSRATQSHAKTDFSSKKKKTAYETLLM